MKPGSLILEQWFLITFASNILNHQKKKTYIIPHSLVYSVMSSDPPWYLYFLYHIFLSLCHCQVTSILASP